jgi:small subunit ribosomal protein S8
MDPIADMLTSIKNGYMAKKDLVRVPKSKFRYEIAKVLEAEKFVGIVTAAENLIEISLVYKNQLPAISEIKKISKLGLRVYTKSKNIKSIKGGKGITIVSTSKGVMTGKSAVNKKLGGEVICQVW